MAVATKTHLAHGGRMEIIKLAGFLASGDVSDPINLALYSEISIHALGSFTGALSLQVQGSNEFDQNGAGITSWIPLRDSNETVIAFLAADLVVVLESPVWMRILATAGAGGGNASVYIKGLRRAD